VTVADDISQLQAQQAYTVQTLRAMLEGKWVGEPPSVEALLLAINPGLAPLQTTDYLLTSEVGEVIGPDWWHDYDPAEYMPKQAASWTCSACSLAWVERATEINPNASEWSAVDEIGNPTNINSTYGLMDGSGAQLQRVLIESYGVPSNQGWLNFDQAYAIYSTTAGMMSGGNWYHWVGVRGVDGNGNLWIANSAPGYKGVYDILSRDDFNRLGPFSCVYLDNG
jgi:hypothetical protein